MDPPIRYFFLNADKTELIKIRSGAFIRNWRATPENDSYPSYSEIRPAFITDFALFIKFLEENNFQPPAVWKCEVTYVNHFIRGREWQEFVDLGALIPPLAPLSSWSGQLGQLQFGAMYQLPGQGNALQVQLLPALRADGKELLQLTFTALGKPKSNEISDLVGCLDMGREAIVQAFCSFTSPEAQKGHRGRI
jgi:uncharacterized protein (TIGR04255 family)